MSMLQMPTTELTEGHPLYQTFVDFHSGELSGEDRRAAKTLLFGIHYSGAYDTRAAEAEAARRRKEREA